MILECCLDTFLKRYKIINQVINGKSEKIIKKRKNNVVLNYFPKYLSSKNNPMFLQYCVLEMMKYKPLINNLPVVSDYTDVVKEYSTFIKSDWATNNLPEMALNNNVMDELEADIFIAHQKQLDENIHTKVLLKEAEKKILKLQEDVEKLIRKNGVK